MNEVFWEFFVSSSSTLEDWGSPSPRIHCSPKPVDYLPVFSSLIPIVVRSVKQYSNQLRRFKRICVAFFLLFTAWESEVRHIFSISSCVFSAEEERPSALSWQASITDPYYLSPKLSAPLNLFYFPGWILPLNGDFFLILCHILTLNQYIKFE